MKAQPPDKAAQIGACYTRLNQLARRAAVRQAKGLPVQDSMRAEIAAVKAEIAELRSRA